MPTQEEVWTRFASEIGAEFIRAREVRLGPLNWKWGVDEVAAKVDSWTVRFDTYTTGYGRYTSTYTRVRAWCLPKAWVPFEVHRDSLGGSARKLLRVQDIEVGDPEFDRDFVVSADDESGVRALLANRTIRQLIRAQPSMELQARSGERNDLDAELYCELPGVITDVGALKDLHRLFAETLGQLREIGAIYEETQPR